MATFTHLFTAEEVEHMPREQRGEIIDGVFIHVPPVNVRHGYIEIRLGALLDAFVRPRRLGIVVAEVGYILRRNPDLLRAPDVSFVRAERIPSGGLPAAFWAIAPDLAIEVISPDERPAEIQSKVREYLEAGVQLVWLVHSPSRTVTVIRSLLERLEFADVDVLDGGEVLPGFSCRVAEIFD